MSSPVFTTSRRLVLKIRTYPSVRYGVINACSVSKLAFTFYFQVHICTALETSRTAILPQRIHVEPFNQNQLTNFTLELSSFQITTVTGLPDNFPIQQ